MASYHPPIRDLRFVMNELNDQHAISALPGFEQASPELIDDVLTQAGVMAAKVLAPLNHSGDCQGTRLEAGKVVSPEGFADAYRQFAENGWQALSHSPDYDGMGLPYGVQAAATELWNAANMSFALCPLLTSGAIEALETHASAALKQAYLPNLISGQWSGTMNLTEPQAGSDLAAVRCRAAPDGDRYRLFGQKIYITWGDHQLAENIIHLVLARLPDAPPGVKGISLFLVPKFLVNADGGLGARNDLKAVSLESKLGIHASPTCVMSFGDADGAVGELIGAPHQGLACMFTMMNRARLEVGIQGVAQAERAYQHAVAYAKDRRQGGKPGVEGRVTIIEHADVRRMLMLMRSLTEAGRAMAGAAATAYDLAGKTCDDAERARHTRRMDLLTPVVKGWCTETAQEVATLGVQVHGGMGFIEETGAAQYLRDARILPIYEGTNGIQALDLIGRKLLRDQGRAVHELLTDIHPTLTQLSHADATELAVMHGCLQTAVEALQTATDTVLAGAERDAELPNAVAFNYLMLMGYTLGGWQMARAALIASTRQATGNDRAFYTAKLKTARFYAEQVLPRCGGLARTIAFGADAVMAMGADDF